MIVRLYFAPIVDRLCCLFIILAIFVVGNNALRVVVVIANIKFTARLSYIFFAVICTVSNACWFFPNVDSDG